jgi:hypothetical protein
VASKIAETSSGGLQILIEVNKSFDNNETYNKNSIATDKFGAKYVNGQPSLVYQADLKPDSSTVVAELVGHGHISGADGSITPDTSKITTALKMFDEIVITTR